MTKLCDACGSAPATSLIGGAASCDKCSELILADAESLRESGKPVNPKHIARRLLKDSTELIKEFRLVDIPAPLWDGVKHRSVADGVTLRDVVLMAIFKHLEERS